MEPQSQLGLRKDIVEAVEVDTRLISPKKPPLKPLQTPSVAGGSRKNIFGSRNLSLPLVPNKTPLPGLRPRVSGAGQFELKYEDQSDHDPLQRIFALQNMHSDGKSTQMRARNASAHRSSKLHEKLKLDSDSYLEHGGQSVIKSQRFKQNWQKTLTYVKIRSSVPTKRESRSLPRGSSIASVKASQRRHNGYSALPQILQPVAGGSSLLNQVPSPFRNIAQSVKHGDQITSAEGELDDQSQISHLLRKIDSPSKLIQQIQQIQQADQSEYLSFIGVGLEIDNASQYHRELIEEKRDEIERILQKRQRKVAFAVFDRQSNASVAQYNRNRQNSQQEDIELPQISPRARQYIKKIDTDKLNAHQLVKRKLSVNSHSSSDLEGTYHSSADATGMRELKLQDTQQTAEPHIKTLEKENQFITEMSLETSKRAQNRGQKSPGLERPSLGETVLKKGQRSRKGSEDLKSIDHYAAKITKNLKEHQQLNRPNDGTDTSPRSYAKYKEAVSKAFDPKKVAGEMKMMTDIFILKNNLGQPDAISEADSELNSPLASGKIEVKPLFKDQGSATQNKRPEKSSLLESKKSPEVAKITTSPVNQVKRLQTLRLEKISKQGLELIKERSVQTPPESPLSSEYKLVEGLVGKRTAMRVQKMIRKSKEQQELEKYAYIRKALEAKYPETGDKSAADCDADANHDEIDSSVGIEKAQFNSEVDIYSEIGSVLAPNSPGAPNSLPRSRRRPSLIRSPSCAMKPIRAEDSEEERGSKSDSKYDEQEYDSAQEDEDQDALRETAGIMNQRDMYKKQIKQNEAAKQEDKELCGPRLVRKIEDFCHQVSVEAGIDLPSSTEADRQKEEIEKYNERKMLETGNTSLFKLENSKNDDQGQHQKVMDKYFDEFRGQQAFFQLCKMAKDSKWTDPNVVNPRMQYFSACTKNNSVAKPILSKIIDKALVIRAIKLNTGDAEGLRSNFMMEPDLITKLYLDQNGLDDSQLALILQGFGQQRQIVNLSIQGNTIDEYSADKIMTMLKRKVPDNLMELHLIHTKTTWNISENLLRQMRQRSYLRKLSLVAAQLNEFSVAHLCEVVRVQKSLQALDISWNQLRPSQMKPLMFILKKNRRLTSLNLAWNNIMEALAEDQDGSDQHTRDIIEMLGKIIKHSPTLQHMNLSGTGLSARVIHEMGTMMRRSRAIQCLHLSGNPGLSQENFAFLNKRIKCRPNEDIERFTRIQATVKNVLRAVGASSSIISGIKMKVERNTEFAQVQKNDPIDYSVNDQLVFQRMLGHKEDIPGSGQWYESSQNAVACKSHYKNECWICEGHVYAILFWSKGMCYKINPILPKDKTEEISFEIDRDFGPQEDADQMYENTNKKYNELPDQVPFICGSFTGWRYRRMIELEAFNEQFEPRQDAFSMAISLGQIRSRVTHLRQCNEYEKRYIEIAALNEKLRLVYEWRSSFSKNLRYKRPYLMNANFYYEMPSRDGTLPDDDYATELGEVFQDTSSDDEETKEDQNEPEMVQEEVLMTNDQKERLRLEEESLMKNPLPKIANAAKLDKVFILPIFCKPGQHNYMVKYKDTIEHGQAHFLKQIKKQERRYHAAQKDPSKVKKAFDKQKYREAKKMLKPQYFFYQCDVPKRKEEIPIFAKTTETKVVQRQFNKVSSVFKSWRIDTNTSLNQAFKEDIKLWKGYRFIKSEEDRADTEQVLKKHYEKLKDVFLYLAANSVWPNIGTLDFCEFAGKAKIIDNTAVNIAGVDRCFIGATLKVTESSAPCNGLRRFEFLEILVRLANIKYFETKIANSFAEATEKLISECILPNFVPEPWQEFRDNLLWTMDVNDIFEANLGHLKTIYLSYKTPSKSNMELADCVTLCTQSSALGLSEKDIFFCFGYSHQTVQSEERNWKKYQSLEFVEFLEFLGRIAHARFKHSSPEMAAQPLSSKVEFILEEIMAGFGLVRQEVNIDVLEFSESDDDY